MLSPTIPHPGYTRAKWGFDIIKCKIPTPLGTPCCQMTLSSLVHAMGFDIFPPMQIKTKIEQLNDEVQVLPYYDETFLYKEQYHTTYQFIFQIT